MRMDVGSLVMPFAGITIGRTRERLPNYTRERRERKTDNLSSKGYLAGSRKAFLAKSLVLFVGLRDGRMGGWKGEK